MIGLQAEQRVVRLAEEEGYAVSPAGQDDYCNKTDLYIEGLPVQVSVQEKSRRERGRLARRGVYAVIAGEQLTDPQVVSQILYIVDNNSTR